jgi:hypothetical protein
MSEEKKMIVGSTLNAKFAPICTTPSPPVTGTSWLTRPPNRKAAPWFV